MYTLCQYPSRRIFINKAYDEMKRDSRIAAETVELSGGRAVDAETIRREEETLFLS